jgi:hypothetical protein
MSADVYIGKANINIGRTSYKVFDDILLFSKELDDGCIEEHYGLGCLDGLKGCQALEVFRNAWHKLYEYGREPLPNEPNAMAQMGLMQSDCVRYPYETIMILNCSDKIKGIPF